jgi:hypothetical protein
MNTFPVERGHLAVCVAIAGIGMAGLHVHAGSEGRQVAARLDAAAARLRATGPVPASSEGFAACSVLAAVGAPSGSSGALLASWQMVAGCGAGASTGTGGGIKWVGRSVTGGLFQAQCQANYVRLDDGYNYVVNTLVNANLSDKFSLGVNIPWLYKYWRDPFSFGYDVSNEGWGDTAVMVTRRLGAINATSLTLSLGIPTGGHKAANRMAPLRQDKQMGHGKFTGGAMVDHTFDNLWGPAVIGATVDYRGGTNDLDSYRAPTASAYAYAGYLLGPFVPVAGLTVTGVREKDRDQQRVQDLPLLTVAANASIEWSTDYFALLLGASIPFDVKGKMQPWTAGLGLSLSPF